MDKMEFFLSRLELKINSKSLERYLTLTLRAHASRVANREEAKVVDQLRLFLSRSLSLCFLLVVSKSLNGSPAEQREKER